MQYSYTYIDFTKNTINGQQATVPEMAELLVKCRSDKTRYLCHYRNDYSGIYTYSDNGGNGNSSGATHD